MRDPDRIDRITAKLAALWHQQPDTRLCQLVSNLAPDQPDPYYVEDGEIEAAIDASEWTDPRRKANR